MKSNTKVGVLTSAHNRYDIRIFHKQCKTLQSSGYEIGLIVADGKGNETNDGIKIYDIGLPKNRFSRMFFFPMKVLLRAIKLNTSIYHLHDPELLLIGCVLKLLGKKVVFDIHENYSKQILLKSYIPKLLRGLTAKFYGMFENFVCSYFDYIIVPQPSMVNKYKSVAKTEVIENFAVISNFEAIDRSLLSPLVFLAGAISEERGIFNLLNAICKLPKSLGKISFVIAGRIPTRLEERIRLHPAWKKIDYLGEVTFEVVRQYYKKTTLGVILYNQIGQYDLCYAIKQFEYMSSGIPFLMPDFGDWKKFNERYKCGINVPSDNPNTVAEAIAYLVKNRNLSGELGRNGLKAAKAYFCWEIAARKLLRIYEELQNAK